MCKKFPEKGSSKREQEKLPACGHKKKLLRVHYFWAVL